MILTVWSESLHKKTDMGKSQKESGLKCVIPYAFSIVYAFDIKLIC